MQTVISLSASASSQEELARILSDYLALDRARIIRRLMVERFGFVAVLAVLLEMVFRGFSPLTWLFTITLRLFPPLWARLVEVGRERRLSRRDRSRSRSGDRHICASVRGRPGAGIRKS